MEMSKFSILRRFKGDSQGTTRIQYRGIMRKLAAKV